MERRTARRAAVRPLALWLGCLALVLVAGAAHAAPCTLSAGGDFSNGTYVNQACNNLSGATNLENMNLSFSNVSGTNFRNSDLLGSIFDGANLSGAIFQNANLTGTSFVGASLAGANLKGANLSGAALQGADLSTASINGGTLWTGATYNASTLFPSGFNPAANGMILPEPKLGVMLLVAGVLLVLPRLNPRA